MWLSKTFRNKIRETQEIPPDPGIKGKAGRSSSSAARSAGPGKVLQAAPGVYEVDSAGWRAMPV